jgi:hypothetical protein
VHHRARIDRRSNDDQRHSGGASRTQFFSACADRCFTSAAVEAPHSFTALTKAEMKTYYVKFTYHGEGEQFEPQVRSYKATSPGEAFEKCLEEYPDAKLIQSRSEGGLGVNYGSISYPPVSTARVVAEPAPKAEETRFPFFDECLGTRPKPFSG